MGANSIWNFRRAILDNEVQSSDDATKIVKLPLSNVLHTLYVKVKCTNGATSAKINPSRMSWIRLKSSLMARTFYSP